MGKPVSTMRGIVVVPTDDCGYAAPVILTSNSKGKNKLSGKHG